MKKFFEKLLSVLGKGEKKVIMVLGDVVERLDWAEREIKDAETKLIDLAHKLHDGIVELEDVSVSAENIIKRHQDILAKATDRKAEFQAKSQVVMDLLDLVDSKIK